MPVKLKMTPTGYFLAFKRQLFSLFAFVCSAVPGRVTPPTFFICPVLHPNRLLFYSQTQSLVLCFLGRSAGNQLLTPRPCKIPPRSLICRDSLSVLSKPTHRYPILLSTTFILNSIFFFLRAFICSFNPPISCVSPVSLVQFSCCTVLEASICNIKSSLFTLFFSLFLWTYEIFNQFDGLPPLKK